MALSPYMAHGCGNAIHLRYIKVRYLEMWLGHPLNYTSLKYIMWLGLIWIP